MRRLQHLDVLRGIAILGILPVNIAFFGLPLAAHDDPTYAVSGSGAEAAVFHLTAFFAEAKFYTLFSLLFGVGIALMRRKAEATGSRFAPLMLRRLGWLWVIGILHATLLWYGDIVSFYAPAGLVLCWAAGWKPSTLAWVGGALVTLPGLLLGGIAGLLGLATLLGGGPPEALSTLTAEPVSTLTVEAASADWGTFLKACATTFLENGNGAFETAVFRDGSYARITGLRTALWGLAMVMAYPLFYGWRIAGMFLLGMALLRAGWLDDPGSRPAPFRRMLWIGLALGVPLQVASIALFAPGDLAGTMPAAFCHYVGSLAMSAAYLGIVCLITPRLSGTRVLAPLAAVGKTALSNYLLQSVLANALFYSYGCALFGRLTRVELLGVTIGIWAVQLSLSGLWMRWFSYGPIEWVWRSFTYWRWVPLRPPAKA